MIIVKRSEVNGSVKAPPSKSHTHRAFFIASLAEGKSRISNALICEDTEATLDAIRMFGSDASWDYVDSNELRAPDNPIYCRRSGTTLRISCAVASLCNGRTVITGDESLRRRPVGPLLRALREIGAETSSSDFPPVVIKGPVRGGRVRIDASLSSQFLTALLIIGPKIGLEIEARGDVSRPYVDITVDLMRHFGADVDVEKGVYLVRGEYRPSHYLVPGDYSSASFLLAAGVLAGRVRVTGLSERHPDERIVDVIKSMGGIIRKGDGWVETERSELEGITVDLSQSPDLLPITSVLASFAKGKTEIKGVEHARVKESDRISSMVFNLREAGINVVERRDGLIIEGGMPRGGMFRSFGDHRVEMAMVVLGLAAEGTSRVEGGRYVDSYPGFIEDLSSLGADVRCLA